MTLLAYDPVAVDGLRRSLRQLADALMSVRCDDPAATGAVTAIRRAADDLTATWLPAVTRVLGADPLRAGSRELAGIADATAWVMADGYGWSVVADPTVGPVPLTTADARALGVRLGSLDVDAVLADPAAMHQLEATLERIARDPALTADFLRNFDAWTAWGEALANARRAGRTPSADLVLVALAHVQRTALAGATGPDAVVAAMPWLDRMDPYSAAAIARHLGLAGDELAAVAHHLLARVADHRRHPSPDRHDVDALDGSGTAELLLPLLLADPMAAGTLLRMAAADPGEILAAFADGADAHRLVLTATDPLLMDRDDAAVVVPAFVQWYATVDTPCDDACRTGPEPPDDWQAFLADLVAPWVVELTPTATAWPLDRAERLALLDLAFPDEASIRRLVDGARVRLALAVDGTKPGAVDPDLERAIAYLQTMAALLVGARVHDARLREEAWQLLGTIAGITSAFAPSAAAGLVEGGAAGWASGDGAPDLARVEHDGDYALDLTMTSTAALVLGHCVDTWTAEGTLPDDVAPPPEPDPHAEVPSQAYWNAFVAWRATLPGGTDGELAREATMAVLVAVNPASAAERYVAPLST